MSSRLVRRWSSPVAPFQIQAQSARLLCGERTEAEALLQEGVRHRTRGSSWPYPMMPLRPMLGRCRSRAHDNRLAARHSVRVRLRFVYAVVAIVVGTGVLTACSGSSGKKQPEARSTSASAQPSGQSTCGDDLHAEWDGQTRSLSSCAGMIGMAASEVEVRLAVGHEVTLVEPPRGVVRSGGETVVPPTLPPIVTNLHSTDPHVLIPRPTSAGLARFRAVSQGVADVVGQSRLCLGGGAEGCAVMHVVVT
jgi:hypothetical protein